MIGSFSVCLFTGTVWTEVSVLACKLQKAVRNRNLVISVYRGEGGKGEE